MGHEPRYSAIAVVERMYPQEAMVRSRNGNDGSRHRQPLVVVHSLESIEKTRQIRSRRWQMRPHLHFPVAKFTRHNPNACTSVRIFNPYQFFRQPPTKLLVNPLDVRRRVWRRFRVFAVVDQALNFNVRPCFQLQDA